MNSSRMTITVSFATLNNANETQMMTGNRKRDFTHFRDTEKHSIRGAIDLWNTPKAFFLQTTRRQKVEF